MTEQERNQLHNDWPIVQKLKVIILSYKPTQTPRQTPWWRFGVMWKDQRKEPWIGWPSQPVLLKDKDDNPNEWESGSRHAWGDVDQERMSHFLIDSKTKEKVSILNLVRVINLFRQKIDHGLSPPWRFLNQKQKTVKTWTRIIHQSKAPFPSILSNSPWSAWAFADPEQ